MGRPRYGDTWWGAQWLQALTQIDHDNRLPRGRTYANRGAVRELAVNDCHIRARVQGSRPHPYVINIGVPPIGSADAARLAQRLASDPGLIARLLNRQLDPAVLEEATALSIKVFPARWSDLDMRCSCPDIAVPCKHLAAVIYLLSREIDGDPYLVFKLRGIDLQALLGTHGGQADAEADRGLPPNALALFEAAPHPDPPNVAPPQGQAALDRLDFTTLPDLREALWRLLPARPVFYRSGDFRELLQKTVMHVARQARQRLDMPLPAEDAETPAPEGRLQIEVNDHLVLAVTGASLAGSAIDSVPRLLKTLSAFRPEQLVDLNAEFAALHTINLLALHLLAKGVVVPQVFAVDTTTVGLCWCAAELDPTVRETVEELATGLPSGLVRHRQGRVLRPLAGGVQARVLLAALIDANLRSMAGQPDKVGDQVLELFFGSGRVVFNGPGEGSTAGSIHAWLSRLHLARQPHVPVLRLDEGQNVQSGGEFALSVAVVDERAALDAPTPLADIIDKPAWARHRMALLKTVSLLADFYPPLNDYVRGGAKRPLVVRSDELPSLLFETLPAMRLLGIPTLLPRALDRLLRPRLSMQIKATTGSVPSFLTADDVLSFDWRVAVGDEMLTVREFERLLGKASGIVNFRGQYVYLNPADVESLRSRLAKGQQPEGAELLRTALASEYDGAPVELNKAAGQLIDQLRRESKVPAPKGLKAALRPYQQRGYAWLWRNARLGLGSLIADDMGLGKTLQVLALLQRLKEDGGLDNAHALVVVPTSLLTNWQKEAARFTPDLTVAVFHGAKRELWKAPPDIVLTTYGVARSDAATLKTVTWRLVVIDEAQNIKNPAAAQAKAVKAIPAQSRVAMSGTPVENRLLEYWSIMDFAQRGFLGGPTHFAHEFATPIQTYRDAAAAERLRKVMAPFMLRRLKSDKSVIDDLPDKVEQDQYCVLSRMQAALYETIVAEGLKVIAGESDTFQRQGLVLQMILALKQVCNHPAHYLKQGEPDPAASGKVDRLMDLLDEITSGQQKALVFTQFREMGDLLVRILRAVQGHEPLFLHGGVSRARRDQLVERFQNVAGERVFLLSLKAGGTGLNLTAASHVVHFDLWWNPAVEAQATDRAYRIGQQRKVQVHRLITRGTFEERINDMIKSKRDLAEMTVGTGESWVGQLPTEELRALFRLA